MVRLRTYTEISELAASWSASSTGPFPADLGALISVRILTANQRLGPLLNRGFNVWQPRRSGEGLRMWETWGIILTLAGVAVGLLVLVGPSSRLAQWLLPIKSGSGFGRQLAHTYLTKVLMAGILILLVVLVFHVQKLLGLN